MFLPSFLSGVDFFFSLDLYLFLSIIWHAGLFFRSYSGNLPAMFSAAALSIFRNTDFVSEQLTFFSRGGNFAVLQEL